MQENWFVCFYFGSFGRLVGSLMSGIVCNVVVVYKRGQQRTFIMLTIIAQPTKMLNTIKSFSWHSLSFEFADWSRIDHVDHISNNSSNREKSPRELVALLC